MRLRLKGWKGWGCGGLGGSDQKLNIVEESD